jgi:hypothetical protein
LACTGVRYIEKKKKNAVLLVITGTLSFLFYFIGTGSIICYVGTGDLYLEIIPNAAGIMPVPAPIWIIFLN